MENIIKILIVEDEPAVLDVTRATLLHIFGARTEIITATNVVDALASINDNPSFDLVVTDMGLPMDRQWSNPVKYAGGEVAKFARQKSPDTKIVVMSGQMLEERKTMQDQCDYVGQMYLPKPFPELNKLTAMLWLLMKSDARSRAAIQPA